MPSSLIIVALAAAWLAVLVPMVARKRQAVSRTADTELAARVVRSAEEDLQVDEQEPSPAEDEDADEENTAGRNVETVDEPSSSRREAVSERRYRPGRGGFDPEAAEIAARAKYAYRQRVVLALIILTVSAAIGAGLVFTLLWWATGLIGLVLVGYLGYLRRQVRIENEIRQRRLARLTGSRGRRPAGRPTDEYAESEDGQEPIGVERRPVSPASVQETAVVVDLDDEDPEFHELDDPGQLPFRRASGE